jgi:type I site-specific restriction endonuclease
MAQNPANRHQIDTDRSWSLERRKAMEEENRTLCEDVKRRGNWRELLEQENERLEEENADLKEKGLKDEEEIKRLKTLMNEQAAVSHSCTELA